ncbi:MAG: NAD(P)/FAD-dependent oxidoreductase [Proteobacteria bacterium]|nr:NAD(P)/FAD-dependent oxidoreductase [Pseudomonadota bacterium]
MHADIDCAVIGAGVVGLAVARACAQLGLSTVVIERHGRVGEETSSRNSEVVHSGIYYPADSLKAKFCVAGRDALYDYCAARAIATKRCGKLIVATSAAEEHALHKLQQRAVQNSVGPTHWLNALQAQAMEPAVVCTAALWIPITGIVDSHDLMTHFVADLEASGGLLALHTRVTRIVPESNALAIFTADGADPLRSRTVINAAGLSGTSVARLVEGIEPTRVPATHYARGCYFDYVGKAPFTHLVYPMPVDGGLGVHATLDLSGRVRFGPDVEWIDTLGYDVEPTRGDSFYAAIRRYWPGLADHTLRPAYAGIRPKLSLAGEPAADFLIQDTASHGVAGLINLLGIESPGLTSSMAIGDYVAAGIAARLR